MSLIGNKKHFLKILSSITVVFLLGAALVISLGCNVSDVNKQNSVGSGTTTGFGSSGGTVANVAVSATANTMYAGGTTVITVILTDSKGNRTDATIILTSSAGGTFNGSTNTSLTGSTSGGALTTTFTAPSPYSYSGETFNTVITSTVAGTNIQGSIPLAIIVLPSS